VEHGRPVISQGYAGNSLRIVNLGAEFSSYVGSPHEALSFYIPRSVLNDFTEEAGSPPVVDLHCTPGLVDPVVAHLGAVLLPALERAAEDSSLFVDHVALALMAHLSKLTEASSSTKLEDFPDSKSPREGVPGEQPEQQSLWPT
jgi:hypothetical protein